MSWQTVWQRKGQLDKNAAEITLSDLIKISGFDTGAGQISDSIWCQYVSQIQKRLKITPATTVCEVGCGAGAFLYPLYEQAIAVTGVDYSETSIAVARQVMPERDFYVSEANKLPVSSDLFDIALCSSVLHYFPTLDYAKQVLQEMRRISKRGAQIAILDIPDLAKRDAAENYRQGQLSAGEYKRLYADYQHFYYDKAWFAAIAEQFALTISIFDQELPGYGNAPYRFNVIFTKRA